MYTGPKLHNDDLVFGYDTGYRINQQSSTRHYKGEPATNLITAGLPGYFGSGGETLYRDNYYGLNSDSGVFQRNFVNNPALANSGSYNNNAGLFKNFTSSTLSTNTEYVLVSFDFYMITPYVRHSNSHVGLNGYMGVLYTDGSTTHHSWNTSLMTPDAGDDWNNNNSYIGKWRKIALYVDLSDAKTPSSISSMYIYNDRTITGEGIFTNFIITEHAAVPTGPVNYTSGTRSSTQSIIDLKKTTDIDVSNVSFDSTGQPEFDGTDDYFTTSGLSTSEPADLTFETVIRFSGSLDSNDRKVFHWDKTNGSNAVAQIRKGNNNGRLMYQHHNGTQWYTLAVDDVVIADTFAHITVVHNGTTATMYKNGVQVGTTPASNLDYTSAGEILLGYRTASEYWKGNIPVFKVYETALSASEIKQNYNAYKNRFNI